MGSSTEGDFAPTDDVMWTVFNCLDRCGLATNGGGLFDAGCPVEGDSEARSRARCCDIHVYTCRGTIRKTPAYSRGIKACSICASMREGRLVWLSLLEVSSEASELSCCGGIYLGFAFEVYVIT